MAASIDPCIETPAYYHLITDHKEKIISFISTKSIWKDFKYECEIDELQDAKFTTEEDKATKTRTFLDILLIRRRLPELKEAYQLIIRYLPDTHYLRQGLATRLDQERHKQANLKSTSSSSGYVVTEDVLTQNPHDNQSEELVRLEDFRDTDELQTKLTNAESNIASNTTEIGQLNDEMSTLRDTRKELQTQLTNAESNISSNTTEIGQLNDEISTLRDTKNELQTQLTNAESNIASNSTKIGQLNDEISTLRDKVKNMRPRRSLMCSVM